MLEGGSDRPLHRIGFTLVIYCGNIVYLKKLYFDCCSRKNITHLCNEQVDQVLCKALGVERGD